mgnify:CR=1 FL=1|jgi:hypothetical protein
MGILSRLKGFDAYNRPEVGQLYKLNAVNPQLESAW